MRLFISMIAVAVVFAASAANAAVTWTASQTDFTIASGDTINFDVQLASDGEAIFGLGGSVYGTDAGIISAAGGTTASAVFVAFATGPGTGFGGLDSSQAIAADPAGGDAGIQFFNGLSIGGTTFTGAGDIGVAGAPGTAQFQLALTIDAAPGVYTLNVGANHPTDGAVGNLGAPLASADAALTITVIPEPGTALLMGLGLVGLASAGRRD